MLPEIDKIDKDLKELIQKRKEIILKIQDECSHPLEAIRECDYRDSTYMVASPPMRVCTLCGFSEDGWGCGYQKLAPHNYDIKTISRDELFKYTRSF